MMNYVLNRDQMRILDQRCIEELKVPSALLMETAGARCADLIIREYPQSLAGEVLVICGSGNNGGDGMVIARHLRCAGFKVSLMLPNPGKMSEETAANLERCRNLEIPIHESDDLMDVYDDDTSLIIDALFGIGFKGSVSDKLAVLIEQVNTRNCFRIAIDIASGLDANTGMGESIRADATIAIEEYKYGHFLQIGEECSGKLHLIKIGMPIKYKQNPYCGLYTSKDVRYPYRPQASHKGSFGRVVLIGGSLDYPGSIMLCAKAALKSGAGLVYLYSRKENMHFYSCPMEIMPKAIVEGRDGLPDEESLKRTIRTASALVIGPGMGTDPYALTLLDTVLKNSTVPTVIDADAITLLAQNPNLKSHLYKRNLLLTPHKVEFCRLQGIEISELNQDIMQHIESFRKLYECNLLLKDHRSIYSDPESTRLLVSGNDALATGGSGDVLTGIIASFAAQKMDLPDAACAASLLMGRTAERLSISRHSFSVTPCDIIEHLGDRDE